MPCHYALPELRYTSRLESPWEHKYPTLPAWPWPPRLQATGTPSWSTLVMARLPPVTFTPLPTWREQEKLPLYSCAENNQWAISVPVERQTAAESLAAKAHGYGFEGIRVDGNDLLAIYQETRAAVEKARDGRGPTLIEAFTYRLEGHSTSDDPRAYREEEQVQAWEKRDP